MTNQAPLSCVLIGSDSLLMECGDLLLAQGHAVPAVVTGAARVRAWARARGLFCLDAGGDYGTALAQRGPFDWLLSISHLARIPAQALKLPARGAVNFHDGLLPQQGGLNAPVWAIAGGETEFGISWHLLTEEPGAGAILLQRRFSIAPRETAVSLNTRCFEEGLNSFAELIDRLSSRDQTAIPQDESARRSSSPYERPEAGGVLDWRRSPAELERLVRALDHGRYLNPLCSPKIAHGRIALIAARAEMDESGGSPGTVLSADAQGLTIACAGGALRLTELRELNGQAVALGCALDRLGASVGETLQGPDDAGRKRLTAIHSRECRHEEFWTRRLLELDPLVLPWPEPAGSAAHGHESCAVGLPAMPAQWPAEERVAAILGAWGAALARLCGSARLNLGFGHDGLDAELGAAPSLHAPRSLIALKAEPAADFAGLRAAVREELAACRQAGSWALDLHARHPGLQGRPVPFTAGGLSIAAELRAVPQAFAPGPHDSLVLVVGSGGDEALLLRDRSRVSDAAAACVHSTFETLLRGLVARPEAILADVDSLSAGEAQGLLAQPCAVPGVPPSDVCVHELVEEQAQRTPDRIALSCEGQSMSYAELMRRSAALSARLAALGAGPEVLVGIHVRRSIDMVVALMGVLRAGAAFLPLDPDLPPARLAALAKDARLGLAVTTSTQRATLPAGLAVVEVDAPLAAAAAPPRRAGASSLAYLLHASCATGKPKGVMVEHRNVVSLFAAMDEKIEHDPPGRWLAVTGLSFDASLLELLWPLARGFEVQIECEQRAADEAESARGIDFGLFVWGSDDAPGARKYELMMGAARFGDTHGFSSISMPERHFHAFGGQYPNPAVTGAAIAAVTQRIAIRSGSSVSPLHHPLRIAEEWAVLDNLSNGRVGLGIAAGWWPEDFVLRPDSFADKKDRMQRDLEVIRRLWRGEAVEFAGPDGKPVARITQPRPVQEELPVWITSAGNPETFAIAGRANAHVLTHLLGQSVQEVAEKIRIYRQARTDAGLDPAAGIVTLMLHTCIGDDVEKVREAVRGPLKGYLASATSLVKKSAWSFPAFRRPNAPDAGLDDIDIDALSADEVDAVLEHAFERYFSASGLFGTPESVQPMIEELKAIGVNEIGCLIDFGLGADFVLAHLEHLDRARQLANRPPAAHSGADGRITHLQCTPSRARDLLRDPAGRKILAGLQQLLIGGERLSPALARALAAHSPAALLNLYGTTETTIWSSSHEVNPRAAAVPIGRPLANSRIYVLDQHHRLQVPGVPGEIHVGGAGVARGYFGLPSLTAARFLPDPWHPGERMYATGDRARLNGDGTLDFLGRKDGQVKIRGHRVELGEIRTVLEEHPGVSQAVVAAGIDPSGEPRISAYFRPGTSSPTAAELREHLRARLPSAMVPAHVVRLEQLPVTPRGEIDWGALPNPDALPAASPEEAAQPQGELQNRIADCWRRVLGRAEVGVRDNFFDVGGHSLLMLRLQLLLREALDRRIALTDLYRFPTVQGLADWIETGGADDGALARSADRAQQRRASLHHRRPRGS